MTAALVRIAVALLIAIFGPRARGLILTLVSLLALFGLSAFAVFTSNITIVLFALILLLGAIAAILLPAVLPRIFVAIFFLLAAPMATAMSSGKIGIAFAVLGFAGILWVSIRRPELAMRMACASAGGQIARGIFPSGHYFVWWTLSALVLFGIEAVLDLTIWPEADYKPPRLGRYARVGCALGATLAIGILLLPALAKPLPNPPPSDRLDLPPQPFQERRTQIEALAPHGGIIWPIPSEAIGWSEPNLRRELFPFFDNLDALYLGAGDHRGFYKIEHTSILGHVSLRAPISNARLVHDAAGLARLRAAADATVAALHDVLPLVKPGERETDLEQALLKAMRAHGCGPESFPLIVASGPEAAAPHGSGNEGSLGANQLVVLDIGCSVDHYASDFTRTLPVSGTFDARQRLLYENVYAAQSAALAECKPGADLSPGKGPSMEKTAREILKSRAPDHDAHMDHGLGHTVGLFVHDIYLRGPLAEGNVITIEPGTYLEKELGIRIEDTFVVTKTGCDRITNGFDASPEAVEKTIQAAR